MSDLHEKTVFVLDHCKPMAEMSGISIEIDKSTGRSRSQQHGYLNFVPPISKTVWSYVVENVIESARIVWDIYAEERLILFLLSNPQNVEPLNSWSKSSQNLNFLSNAFATSSPLNKQNGSIENGLKAAIEYLSQPTQAQSDAMIANKSTKYRALNKGRIILLTSCIVDFDIEEFFVQALNQQSKVSSNSDHLINIHEIELVVFSIHPIGKEHMARVLSTPIREIAPMVRSSIIVTTPEKLNENMTRIIVQNHGLSISTVIGIPMKEEANSASSSNYDVQIFHPRIPNSTQESLVLKWSTQPANQKGSPVFGALSPCQTAFRITPVEVTSRPTTCLTNFVLNGRLVWLEASKKSKTTSHVLASHGGEIWLHIMETARNILEDPPSISNSVGGRVTDYRITDFQEFMKLNMLIPYPEDYTSKLKSKDKIRRNSLEEPGAKKPIEMAKARLTRKSKYWPETINSSLLFPMSVHLENLLRLMPRDILTESEKEDCDKTIWSLMTIEARGDAPPLPSPQHKKGHKKDEAWKAVYNELEIFLKANQYSENHRKVLECFLESRKDGMGNKSEKKKRDNIALDDIVGELQSKLSGLARPIADSPMSPTPEEDEKPLIKKRKHSVLLEEPPKALSLFDFWTAKTEKKDPRLKGLGTKLYAHLEVAQDKNNPIQSKINSG